MNETSAFYSTNSVEDAWAYIERYHVEYVIVGNTTGAVTGVVSELRIESGPEMSQVLTAPKGSKLTFPHEGDARRGDQVYRMRKLDLIV